MPLIVRGDAFGYDLHPTVELWLYVTCLVFLVIAMFVRVGEAKEQRVTHRDTAGVRLAVAISVVVMGVVVVNHGFRIFHVHKLDSQVHPVLYIVWRLSASFAFVACFVASRWRISLIPALILVLTFLAGDRTALGLSLVAAIWSVLARRKVGVARFARMAVLLLVIGLLLLFGKFIQAAIITNDSLAISQDIIEVGSDFENAIRTTEPFVVSGVFSRIVGCELVAPVEMFVRSFGQMFPWPSAIGFDSAEFNDYYQPVLFPGMRERSLAYSFWGEGHCYFGNLGMLLFLVIHGCGLVVFSRMSRSMHASLRVFAYLGGAYWAFYIYRNSLASILAYERHIALYFVAWWMASGWSVAILTRRRLPS